MQIIKTLNDLKAVKKNSNLGEEYLDYIEAHLRRIWNTFSKEEAIEDHPDRPTAELVILEVDNELKEEVMKEVGVPYNLLKAPLEYVDQLQIDDMTIYIIGISKTNEMLMECFLNPKHFTKSIKDWLEANSVTPDYYQVDGIKTEDVPF
jgi:hypothetical protein